MVCNQSSSVASLNCEYENEITPMYQAPILDTADVKSILIQIEEKKLRSVSGDTEKREHTNQTYTDHAGWYYKLDGTRRDTDQIRQRYQNQLDNQMIAMHYASFLNIHTTEDFASAVVTCQNDNLHHGQQPDLPFWKSVKVLRLSEVSGETVKKFEKNKQIAESVRQDYLLKAALNTIVTGTMLNDNDRNKGNVLIDATTGQIGQIDLEGAVILPQRAAVLPFLHGDVDAWYKSYEASLPRETVMNAFIEQRRLVEHHKQSFAPDHYNMFVKRAEKGITYAQSSYRLAD